MAPAQNIEVVRRMLQAYRSPAPEQSLEFFHPEVEFDTRVRPDGRMWRGREGVRRAMVEWTGAWTGYEMEVERLIDAGGDRVVALWRERGRAKVSGVPMSQAGLTVYTMRDGLIVSMVATLERRAMLQELGLPAQ
jgi:ketosteroid isomerase-like protein